MSSGTGRTEYVNGIDMYYTERGRGDPLVLLHGFTGTGSDWNLIFIESPDGFRLIAPDLRGHGRSTNPSKQFTHRQAALDVFALLDRLGIERFKAAGMSTGAKCLLHMATQQPARVEAMILVSGAHYFPDEARSIMGRMTIDSRTDEDWRFMRQRHKHGDDQIRMLWHQARAFKDSYDDVNFTPPYLSTIAARTLIVHGDRDPVYPVRIPVEMYGAIPRSFLWIVPNGGHIPVFGSMTTRFLETALSFLRGEWGRT